MKPAFGADTVAGLSVAGLMLPEAVAYAAIAGLAPGKAIVAAVAGGLAYAALGRSRFAIVAPTSSSAAILAAALATIPGTASDKAMMATAMVAMVGGLFGIIALFRLGSLAGFIARPVLRGFAFGLAITATSLPVIAKDLAENPIALKLALTSYLVSLAVFIPVSGWMADRYGSRTVFRAAIAVFVCGSLACGFSSSLGGFVIARFVQGMGGAMMVPVGRLVLLKSVEKRELVKVLSYLTMPALLGPILGPPLGGFISTYFHWRWIFFVNVPIGVIGWTLAGRYVPEIVEDARTPLDWLGFLLSGIGLSALTLGAATLGQHLLAPTGSALCIGGGIGSLVLYVRHARRFVRKGRTPVLDFRFLRVKTYFAGVVGGSLFRIGVGASPFLLPLMLQLGFGFTALQSGLLTCSSAAAAMFMKTLATTILKRFGFRTVLSINALIASMTIIGYGAFSSTTPIAMMLGLLLFGGFFRSLQFTSLNALSYADIDKHDMGGASGLANVAQQMSLSTGVTLGAAALESAAALHGRVDVVSDDFRWAFLVVGLVSASSFWLIRRLPVDAGDEVSGRQIRQADPPLDPEDTPKPTPPLDPKVTG